MLYLYIPGSDALHYDIIITMISQNKQEKCKNCSAPLKYYGTAVVHVLVVDQDVAMQDIAIVPRKDMQRLLIMPMIQPHAHDQMKSLLEC